MKIFISGFVNYALDQPSFDHFRRAMSEIGLWQQHIYQIWAIYEHYGPRNQLISIGGRGDMSCQPDGVKEYRDI
jgi:hypothetical protein